MELAGGTGWLAHVVQSSTTVLNVKVIVGLVGLDFRFTRVDDNFSGLEL
jgi:hypothetical protein